MIEAAHECMKSRGVFSRNSLTTTSAYTGIFKTNSELKKEFLSLIPKNNSNYNNNNNDNNNNYKNNNNG